MTMAAEEIKGATGSLSVDAPAGGLHVAIIMDGNGRWATARGLPRVAGHQAGAEAVRRTVEAAPKLGIKILTLYAFSSDNWQRPPEEVNTLMRLFHDYLERHTSECVEHGIRLTVIGRRDRLDPQLRRAIERAEAATAEGRQLHLRIAVDYSARDAIVQAARYVNGRPVGRAEFAHLLGEAIHAGEPVPDVDLLIRTGGEQRLSDFLLWECAYAELYFTSRMWPDFDAKDLEAAVQEFHRRERRFGRVPAPGCGASVPVHADGMAVERA
jgi:undecaprenyl diphosphate synthase